MLALRLRPARRICPCWSGVILDPTKIRNRYFSQNALTSTRVINNRLSKTSPQPSTIVRHDQKQDAVTTESASAKIIMRMMGFNPSDELALPEGVTREAAEQLAFRFNALIPRDSKGRRQQDGGVLVAQQLHTLSHANNIHLVAAVLANQIALVTTPTPVQGKKGQLKTDSESFIRARLGSLLSCGAHAFKLHFLDKARGSKQVYKTGPASPLAPVLLSHLETIFEMLSKAFPEPPPDSLTTIMMDTYTRAGMADKAVALFQEVERRGNVDEYLCNAAVEAWSILRQPRNIITLLEKQALRTKSPDIILWNNALNVVGRLCGGEVALNVFAKFKSLGGIPNVEMMTTAINRVGMSSVSKGLRLFEEMKEEHHLEPTQATYHALMKVICAHGDYRQARQVMTSMVAEGHQPEVRTFDYMMNGFANAGALQPALDLHQQVMSGGFGSVKPSDRTWNILLDIVGSTDRTLQGDFRLGLALYRQALEMNMCRPKTKRHGILDLRGYLPGTVTFVLWEAFNDLVKNFHSTLGAKNLAVRVGPEATEEMKANVLELSQGKFVKLLPKRGLIILFGATQRGEETVPPGSALMVSESAPMNEKEENGDEAEMHDDEEYESDSEGEGDVDAVVDTGDPYNKNRAKRRGEVTVTKPREDLSEEEKYPRTFRPEMEMQVQRKLPQYETALSKTRWMLHRLGIPYNIKGETHLTINRSELMFWIAGQTPDKLNQGDWKQARANIQMETELDKQRWKQSVELNPPRPPKGNKKIMPKPPRANSFARPMENRTSRSPTKNKRNSASSMSGM